MSFISGAYNVTYNASTLGQIENGITLEAIIHGEVIRGDYLSQSIQDAVYQGGDLYFNMILLEYNAAAAKSAFWPMDATLGTVGTVGKLFSSFAKALVLTAVANTPAVASPASLTAPKTVLAPGYPINLLFAPALRRVPLRLLVLPSQDDPAAHIESWFSTT